MAGVADIRETVLPILAAQARCFREEIRPALVDSGIHLVAWGDLTAEDRTFADEYFRQNVFPVLTPQSVDSSHPFPFLSNLSHSLAIAIRYPGAAEKHFARVKVPKLLPQWIELEPTSTPGNRRFVSLQEIIIHNLDECFPV